MHNQVVVDCSATHHMFNSPKFFPNLFEKIQSKVATGDSQSNLLAHGIGNAELKCNGQILHLKNCLFVPKLKCNLICMLELFKDQLTIQQTDNSFSLSSKEKVLLQGEICNRLMYITYDLPQTFLTLGDGNLWHCRLGHPGRAVLKNLARYPLDTIHIDLPGPITPESVSGFRFLITIVDQATLFKIIKFLKRKSNSFDQFVITKNYIENWHNRPSKKLVSHRGGEFLNQKFKNLSNECGFTHIFSPPETPEHNGYAKRANRTVLEKARCLMNHSNLPNQYWAEAISTAVFLYNLSPTPSRGNKSPYVLWTNTPAKLTRLQPFGCQAVIHNLKRQRDWKLAPPGQDGVLLGFEYDNTAYRILRLSDLTVVVTRNVTFNEKVFPAIANGKTSPFWHITGEPHENKAPDPMAKPIESSTFGNTQIMDNEHLNCHEEPTSEPDTESSSTPGSSLPSCRLEWSDQQQSENNIQLRVIGPRHPTLINSDVDPTHILPYSRRARAFVMTSNIAPRTYCLALQCKDKTKWMTAIERELSEMNKLKLWDIVELKSDYKLVGMTWVFKVKKDHLHHTIEHKAHLCTQGFTQTPGIDFKKTYAPTG
ncbi:hypothetical protein O181_008093 [Austropuccinia psidii MF-1]|uniref:Integrase catalytic domain-containing protein n=1 Tax=Austropuccinia psidii MF-1 TaxID=1389203 RepID=A0A9Q3BNG3_9BASI|nr:hypothetical protein [Austropuccinia psidii MF-1]